MGVLKESPIRNDTQEAACQICSVSGPSDPFFPQKPTPDKYSASDRLKGESPPGPGSHTHICKHLQIPPDETKDSSSRFPWERLAEATFQPNKVSTVEKKKTKNEGRQYFNVTQRALSSQSSVYEVSGTLERLEHQATLKRRALKQHVKHIAGKGILINWFASIFLRFFRVCGGFFYCQLSH